MFYIPENTVTTERKFQVVKHYDNLSQKLSYRSFSHLPICDMIITQMFPFNCRCNQEAVDFPKEMLEAVQITIHSKILEALQNLSQDM